MNPPGPNQMAISLTLEAPQEMCLILYPELKILPDKKRGTHAFPLWIGLLMMSLLYRDSKSDIANWSLNQTGTIFILMAR